MFAQVEFGLCDEKECISIILDNEESVWCGDEHYLRITTKRVEEK